MEFKIILITVTILEVMAVSSYACVGVKYTVGDSYWTIPSTPNFYSNWSSTYFFKPGDSLVFNFETSHYNVIQVSRQEYDSCTACNPFKTYTNSPAIFPLKERGVFYFVSNISNYCNLGLKVSVTVHRCSSKPTPPPRRPPTSTPIPISPSPLPTSSSTPSPAVELDIIPAPAPYDGSSPEAGGPPKKSTASMSRIRIRSNSMGMIFVWGVQLCLLFFCSF